MTFVHAYTAALWALFHRARSLCQGSQDNSRLRSRGKARSRRILWPISQNDLRARSWNCCHIKSAPLRSLAGTLAFPHESHRNTPSATHWGANDFYGAFGMASDEFRNAAKQETLDASLPMRTNDDQIGAPLCCGIDDALPDVTYLDGGVHLESCITQLFRNSLDQLPGRLLQIFQLRSIAWRHLRWSGRNRLQHMQDPDLSILSSKLRDDGP